MTAQLFRNGGSSCPIGGSDKGVDLVTSGWVAGDAETLLTSLCAGTASLHTRNGYIEVTRIGGEDQEDCDIHGFRVPGSGPLTIRSAPEGRGRIAYSSQRHGVFDIASRRGPRGELRLAPCLANSEFDLGGKTVRPIEVR